MENEELINKIVRMFETGELSTSQRNHSCDGYDIIVEKKDFRHHGIDGFSFQFLKEKENLFKIFYDSWSRVFYQDTPKPIII